LLSLQGFDIRRGIHKKRILPPEDLRGFENPEGLMMLKIPSYESLFLYQILAAKQQKKSRRTAFYPSLRDYLKISIRAIYSALQRT
jgi:hypothetical protein